MNYDVNAVADESDHEEVVPQPKQKVQNQPQNNSNLLNFAEDPIISGGGPTHGLTNSSPRIP
jgi:hypothetical protein